ncbi:methyltransferase domain-containing protein [Aquibium sp. A9E412]|uniref:RsmB/NOP family class I SAM-dependent RNA methyltransferase n=1 Tax=Aquibium sp. A9E412 TaxID=2976767 RepID=UPI0025B247EB|nr:RsmB/NOP family class I SAM-dependent RNA methyltransferase [Aquibium sp. A9E412]MDN2565737.1 methyltransferase domain-containing protein [Aquibium sp. A9E412]
MSRARPRRTDRAARHPAAPSADGAPGLAARQAAARLLAAVVDARTPLDALTDAENGHPQYRALSPRDRLLVRAIVVSALRHRVTITRMIEGRLERPLPAKARTLMHVLHVGAAQLFFLDVPDRAAVDLAVAHAKADPRTARFAALVNAVLRGLQRGRDEALPRMLAETRDAPDWLIERLTAAYGAATADAVLAAHREPPPTDFTVRADAAAWAARLGGIVLPTGSVRLAELPGPVAGLPGYAEGAWWVQDAAAALPARLLGPVDGLAVLDLCAAPGGKTAQLAAAGARVTAVDRSTNRLARLEANLARLDLAAETVAADALVYRPDAPFDAVLLDAPCSSTGTIRRHPDVAWTKTPADIATLAELQGRLLAHAVTLVRPGGAVVFANCSLDPAEGEDLLEAFLASPAGATVALEPVAADEVPGIAPFVTAQGTLRTTPAGMPGTTARLSGLDGFFAARLRRMA